MWMCDWSVCNFFVCVSLGRVLCVYVCERGLGFSCVGFGVSVRAGSLW